VGSEQPDPVTRLTCKCWQAWVVHDPEVEGREWVIPSQRITEEMVRVGYIRLYDANATDENALYPHSECPDDECAFTSDYVLRAGDADYRDKLLRILAEAGSDSVRPRARGFPAPDDCHRSNLC
jgi:hypothetical protein